MMNKTPLRGWLLLALAAAPCLWQTPPAGAQATQKTTKMAQSIDLVLVAGDGARIRFAGPVEGVADVTIDASGTKAQFTCDAFPVTATNLSSGAIYRAVNPDLLSLFLCDGFPPIELRFLSTYLFVVPGRADIKPLALQVETSAAVAKDGNVTASITGVGLGAGG